MTPAEAQDRLRCWNRAGRWRRVTRVPVPAKWLIYGDPPKSISEIMTICWTAHMPPMRGSAYSWAESAFLRELERQR
mgnify:CR=1 FL=1